MLNAGRHWRVLALTALVGLTLSACPARSGPRTVTPLEGDFPSRDCDVKVVDGYVGDTFVRFGYTPGAAIADVPVGGVAVCMRLDLPEDQPEEEPVRDIPGFGGKVEIPSDLPVKIDENVSDEDCNGQRMLGEPGRTVSILGTLTASIRATVALAAPTVEDPVPEVRACLSARVEETGEELFAARLRVTVSDGAVVPPAKLDVNGHDRDDEDTSNQGLASAQCREKGARGEGERRRLMNVGLGPVHLWLDSLVPTAGATVLCVRAEGPGTDGLTPQAAGGNLSAEGGLTLGPDTCPKENEVVTVQGEEGTLSVRHGDLPDDPKVCASREAGDQQKSFSVSIEPSANASSEFDGDVELDSTIRFGQNPVHVDEGKSVDILVVRSGLKTGAAGAGYRTEDRTEDGSSAKKDSDYTSKAGTLAFAPTEDRKTVTVQTTQDTAVEGDESFTILLHDPTPGATLGEPVKVSVVIRDDDSSVSFSSSRSDVKENAGSATIAVRRWPATSTEVSVKFATADGTARKDADYRARSGTLSFAAEETRKTFSVTILNDRLHESGETINLTLSNPVGAAVLADPKTATLTILDNDPRRIRPDALIRRSTDASYIGNNVYNTTGTNQTRTMRLSRGTRGTFYIRVQNDGNAPDSFRITGTASGGRITVRYLLGSTDITSAVVAGTYTLRNLAPGSGKTITVRARPRSDARRGSSRDFLVSARSTAATTRDVAKATVTVR